MTGKELSRGLNNLTGKEKEREVYMELKTLQSTESGELGKINKVRVWPDMIVLES